MNDQRLVVVALISSADATVLGVKNPVIPIRCYFLAFKYPFLYPRSARSGGALEMNIGVVSYVDAASDHIAKYGTNHTEAIVTENQAAGERFIAFSDCAVVMVNTSTYSMMATKWALPQKSVFSIRNCMPVTRWDWRR